MPIRVYLSPIVGTGTAGDPYRPKVANYGLPWVAVIAGQPDGRPKFAWSLVLVNASDFTALNADAQLLTIPNVTLDSPISDLTSKERSRIQAGLTQRGIAITVADFETVGALLDAIGKTQNPEFSLGALTIAGETE